MTMWWTYLKFWYSIVAWLEETVN